MTGRSVVVTNADGEPGRTIAHALDRAGDRVATSVPEAVERCGCLDALVNCYRFDASIGGPVEDLDVDEFCRGLTDNLSSAFFTAQLAARQMLSQDCAHASDGRRGCIVSVTSVAGVVALPGQSTFCAAMAGLTTATKVLATEWAPRGIRVAAVGAGLMPELVEGLRQLPGAARRVPKGSLVDPMLVAETVRFVLSDAGAGIAGVPVYVDAGWLADGYWEVLSKSGLARTATATANVVA